MCVSTRGAQILGAWAQNFVWWCSNIFSIIIADFPVMYKNVYQFTFSGNFLVILFILLITDSEAMFVVFALLFSYHPED